MESLKIKHLHGDGGFTQKSSKIIQDLVEKRDWANLGRKLYNMSYEYQEGFAESELYRTNEF
jgi:hypothetical protein